MQFITVGLLALVIWPIVSSILLLAVIAADLICAICETYFLSIPECLENVGVFHAFSGPKRFAAVAVIVLALLVAAIALFLRAATVRKCDRRRAAACLVAFAVLIVSADVLTIIRATGRFPNPWGGASAKDAIDPNLLNGPRFARISILRLVRIGLIDAETHNRERKGEASPIPVASATDQALHSMGVLPGAGNQELPNLVVVVVESWGLPSDVPLQQALVQPYVQPDIKARYEVVQGTVPFYGPTIAGEARELCGTTIGFHILNASADELKSCLPARLAALGYHNIALHGMSGHVFRRSSWYTTIGFQERWFNSQFKQQGLPDCMGAFVGTCDSDISNLIGRRLKEAGPHPNFIYWMTLNSHLPVLVPSVLSGASPCLAALSLSPNSPLCSWYQLVVNVHQSVSELAMSDLARPTIFVVVGDHAPPFVDLAVRGRFSSAVVPYLLLIPRRSHESHGQMLARGSLAPLEKSARHYAQIP